MKISCLVVVTQHIAWQTDGQTDGHLESRRKVSLLLSLPILTLF